MPGPSSEHEVLVRVRAAVVSSGDWRMVVADPWVVRLFQGIWRIRRPVLGHGLAGEVAAVGDGVTDLAPGDLVFGEPAAGGGFAEYAILRRRELARVPEGVDLAVAAAAPVAGFTALQAVRDHGELSPGGRVLVIGAGGAVGTAAIQVAAHLGGEVTAVDSTAKRDHVLAAGASELIDREGFDIAGTPGAWDLIVDMIGSAPIGACRRALREGGRYVAVSGPLRRTAALGLFSGSGMRGMVSKPNAKDLEVLRGWLAEGVLRPVVAERMPLEAAAEALARVGAGGLVGSLVLEP